MGIKFEIDLDAGVVFGVATGDVGTEEILDYVRRLLEDPKYRPDLYSLLDLRKAKPHFSEEDARRIAQMRVTTPSTRKLAIVATEAFGHARMFHGWTGIDSNIMIFKEMQSAREWLGLPSENDS